MVSTTIFPIDTDMSILKTYVNEVNPPLLVAVDMGFRYCKAAFTFKVSTTDGTSPKVGLIYNYPESWMVNPSLGSRYNCLVPVVTCTDSSEEPVTNPAKYYWGYLAQTLAEEFGDRIRQCWPLRELAASDGQVDFATEQLTSFIAQLLFHISTQLKEVYWEDIRPNDVGFVFSIPSFRGQAAVEATVEAAIRHAVRQSCKEASIFSATVPQLTIIPATKAAARFVGGHFQSQLLPGECCLVLDGGATTIDAVICEAKSPTGPLLELPIFGHAQSGLECLHEAFRTHLMEQLRVRQWDTASTTLQQQDRIEYAVIEWTRRYWWDGKMQTYKVSLPGLTPEPSGENAGCVILKRKNLKAIFLNCVEEIKFLLETMLEKAIQSKINVTKVAVVGGIARLKIITRPGVREPLEEKQIALLRDSADFLEHAALYGCLDLALGLFRSEQCGQESSPGGPTPTLQKQVSTLPIRNLVVVEAPPRIIVTYVS
jgi:hypothetical protein